MPRAKKNAKKNGDAVKVAESPQVQELPKQWRAFDDSLRCEICADYFSSAVTIQGCGHSFCSGCIRVHFSKGVCSSRREAWCPKCRFVVKKDPDLSLVPNHSLQQVLQEYRQMAVQIAGDGSCIPPSGRSDACDDANTANLSNETCIRRQSTPDNSTMDTDDVPQTPRTVLKKRGKTVYTGMRKNKLKELCKREGLQVSGTEADLIARHRLYQQIWNHHADNVVEEPTTKDQILAMVRQREKSKNDVAKQEKKNGVSQQNDRMAKLKDARSRVGKGAKDIKITSGDAEFDSKLNDGFSNLIQQLHRQEATNKAKGRPSAHEPQPKDDSSKATASTSAAKKAASSKAKTATTKTRRGKQVASAKAKIENGTEAITKTDAADPPKRSTRRKLPKRAQRKADTSDSATAPMSSDDETAKTQSTADTSTSSTAAAAVTRKTKRGTKRNAPSPTPSDVAEIAEGEQPSGRSKRKLAVPWDCSVCTFRNTVRTWKNANCEMCSTKR